MAKTLRKRRTKMQMINEWAERNVYKPAQAALKAVPEIFEVECDECEGTGRDEFCR